MCLHVAFYVKMYFFEKKVSVEGFVCAGHVSELQMKMSKKTK